MGQVSQGVSTQNHEMIYFETIYLLVNHLLAKIKFHDVTVFLDISFYLSLLYCFLFLPLISYLNEIEYSLSLLLLVVVVVVLIVCEVWKIRKCTLIIVEEIMIVLMFFIDLY